MERRIQLQLRYCEPWLTFVRLRVRGASRDGDLGRIEPRLVESYAGVCFWAARDRAARKLAYLGVSVSACEAACSGGRRVLVVCSWRSLRLCRCRDAVLALALALAA